MSRGPNRIALALFEEEPWRHEASCRGSSHFFAPDHEKRERQMIRHAQAILICRSCPVQTQCAEYATLTSPKFGVWGGKIYDKVPGGYRRTHDESREDRVVRFYLSFTGRPTRQPAAPLYEYGTCPQCGQSARLSPANGRTIMSHSVPVEVYKDRRGCHGQGRVAVEKRVNRR